MSNKKAIITGAAGFLGRYCAKELAAQGFEVIGIDMASFPESQKWGLTNFRITSCDRGTLTAIAKETGVPDLIIHCAGSGSVPDSFRDPHHDFSANVATCMEVLEFCRLNPSVKLAIPSSAAVYGNAETLPINEDAPLRPMSPYGVHKKIIEELCVSYARFFQVKVSLIRFFSLYGIGLKKQIIWDACRKASSGEFAFSGDGVEMRDFLHVEDAARLLIKAADIASTDVPIMNGGTGKGTAIREIVEAVGACWSPVKTPAFSGEKRAGDPTHFVADTTKLRTIFQPQKNLKQEIASYVKWFQTPGNE